MKRCDACHQPSPYLIAMTWKDGTWKRICEWCREDLIEWREAQKKKGAVLHERGAEG